MDDDFFGVDDPIQPNPTAVTTTQDNLNDHADD